MNNIADADEKLKEIVVLSRLYDTYGQLLNEHTRVIFESYVMDNYSLAEIAEEQGITRQGVRDIVVRGSKKLYELEEKLGFLKKTDEIVSRIRDIQNGTVRADAQAEATNGRINSELQEIIDILEN